MAAAASTNVGLALPRETFARLTPAPFLQAHLKSNIRPSGRRADEFRQPTINKGSLTHANGSAVVRVGNTAVVCGVRGEILRYSDIPNPPKDDASDETLIEELGLVIPNVELSTGCSPSHLPGNAPGSQAQALSYRINAILQPIIRPADLHIEYEGLPVGDGDETVGPQKATKGYWALYVDILCMALDGNALDSICLAAVAALQDTILPSARWDPDREAIICSPLKAESRRLSLKTIPITTTFAVYSTASSLKQSHESENWMLADPDGFEEECCDETVTLSLEFCRTSASAPYLRIEKNGGTFLSTKLIRVCSDLALSHCAKVRDVLDVQ